MRLVILTGTGPEHRYVAAALAAAFPQDLQAIVLAEPPPKSLWVQARSYARRYTVPQLGSRPDLGRDRRPRRGPGDRPPGPDAEPDAVSRG